MLMLKFCERTFSLVRAPLSFCWGQDDVTSFFLPTFVTSLPFVKARATLEKIVFISTK